MRKPRPARPGGVQSKSVVLVRIADPKNGIPINGNNLQPTAKSPRWDANDPHHAQEAEQSQVCGPPWLMPAGASIINTDSFVAYNPPQIQVD